jgi:ketosteroid isomerase-like protein
MFTEEQRAAVVAEVDTVMKEWWGIWAGSGDIDFDRGMSFITDEPETVWVNDGQVLLTKAVIQEVFRPFFAALQRQIVTPIESRTIALASDVVYTIRAVNLVRIDTAGNEQPAVQFVETIVWVKRNGGWKVLTGSGSTPSESM